MGTKRSSSQLKAYLPVNLTDAGSAFLRLLISFTVLTAVACTQNTINQTNPPVSQANPDTRVSDPDDWGGAGTGDGGGGQGVMCSADVDDPRLKGRLMLRDIFEAQYNLKLTIASNKLGPAGTDKVGPEAIDFLREKMWRFFGATMAVQTAAELGFWEKFEKNISFIDEKSKLISSNDANSPLSLPKGCKLVQLAYWSDAAVYESGTLYVDKPLWTKLDQFNKMALLVHEYYFKLARSAGFKNSDYVRSKVGRLLSEEGLEPLLPNWEPSTDETLNKEGLASLFPKSRKGFKICTGATSSPLDQMILFQYQDSEGLQNVVWVNLAAGDVRMPPFERAILRFDPKNPNASLVTSATDYLPQSVNQPIPEEDLLRPQVGNRLEQFADYPDARIGSVTVPLVGTTGLVSMRNPFAGYIPYEMREPKSREELIRLMQRRVFNTFEKIGSYISYTDHSRVLFALAQLDEDIEQAFKTKTYPIVYSKWTSALAAFSTASLSQQDSDFLYTIVPATILSFKRNVYSNEEIFNVLGDAGFVKTWKNGSYGGRVVANLGKESKEFDVSCRGYDEHYKNVHDAVGITNKEEGTK